MANQLLSSSLILERTLAAFINNLGFLACANRAYETEFTEASYRTGGTVTIRKPVQYNVGDQPTLLESDTLEQFVTLSINKQPNVGLQFNSRDLTLTIDQFEERYINPAAIELANYCDKLIAQDAALNINNWIGTPGVPINTFGIIADADAKLDSIGVPIANRYMGITPQNKARLSSSLQNSFNPVLNDEISFMYSLGRLANFDIFFSQNLQGGFTSGVGAGGTPLNGLIPAGVTSAAVTSGNIIPVSGLAGKAATAFKVGDHITIGGVNSVTKTGRTDTGLPMQFVVVAWTPGGDTNSGTLQVSPAIVSDPASPYRNVTNAVPNDAPITLAASHQTNVAFQKDALLVAMPPLELPESAVVKERLIDPETGISMRLTSGYDVRADNQIWRIDVLLGWTWVGDYATLILS